MIHPQTQLRFINDQIGYGVFATAVIPAGTIVYVQDGLDIAIPPDSPLFQEPHQRQAIEKYATVDPPDGRRVISWDIAKYINHCCHCNVISTGYGFEIALRDIQPDEEITDEYGLFNLDWDLKLICQQTQCRGRLSPLDFDQHWLQWDAQIQAILRQVLEVPQPLWSLLDAETKAQLHEYLTTGQGYRSVRWLHLEPTAVYPDPGF